MLDLKIFTFNPFQENTYLLFNERKECWIIDPGMYGADEEKMLFDYITLHQLTPQQIINTHTHIDHIFGIDALKQRYHIPFGMHELDLPVLSGAAGSAMLFGFSFRANPTPDFLIKHNTRIALGEDQLEVRWAPGHSPGSIIFYYAEGKWAISGDVLFQSSIGRTDLPGGNQDTLMNSIREQLYTLPDDTIIYPGHGPATSIGQEKTSNPFVRP